MIYIHIGRGKAASSTIQWTLSHNRQNIVDRGFHWPAFSSTTRGSASGVGFALMGRTGHDTELVSFKDAIRRCDKINSVVSSERLLRASPDRLNSISDETPVGHVSILLYVREYGDWIRSVYCQNVKKGRVVDDFDKFFTRHNALSYQRPIGNWATAFGDDSIRVAYLDALPVDVIDDLARHIGVEFAKIPNKNVSPSWVEIEFIRALNSVGPIKPPGTGRLLKALRDHAGEHPIPVRPQYITPRQHSALVELYEQDAEFAHQRFGAVRPGPVPPVGERPFLPSVRTFPDSLKTMIVDELLPMAQSMQHSPIGESLARVVDNQLA